MKQGKERSNAMNEARKGSKTWRKRVRKKGGKEKREKVRKRGSKEGRKQGRKEARTNERNAHLKLEALVQLVLALSPCPIKINNLYLKGGHG